MEITVITQSSVSRNASWTCSCAGAWLTTSHPAVKFDTQDLVHKLRAMNVLMTGFVCRALQEGVAPYL